MILEGAMGRSVPLRVGAMMLAAAGLAAGCGSDEPLCDSATVEAALESADEGDTVTIGACRVQGPFTVPSGVALRGRDRDSSIIEVPAATVGLTLAGDAQVSDLRIESSGYAAVIARTSSSVTIERVDLDVDLGLGIGAQALSELVLTDVDLRGPVTRDNANEISLLDEATSRDQTGTYGLITLHVGDAQLTDVTSSGFAFFGAALIDTGTTWTGGGTPANLRNGLMVYEGTTTLTTLDLCDTMKGLEPLANAGVFAAGAVVDSTGLSVCASERLGLLHDDATAHHVDLVASDNLDAAVWVQNCPSFEISGSGSALTNNRFAGIAVLDSTNVVVSDATISGTELSPRFIDVTGRIDVGDGLQLVGSTEGIQLSDLTLSGNQRVGMLIDLDGATIDDSWLAGITVDGTGTELGVIAQNGTLGTGWDGGVDRQGDTLSNDADFFVTGTPIDTIEAIGPNTLPVPDLLLSQGLAALVDP